VPTYSYACTACEHQFDTVQSFTDPSLTDCPECSGRLRKLFSPVGIVFKGSGFYRTDSRAGGSSNGKAEGSKDRSTPESASESGTKKPATSSSSTKSPSAAAA
jgi:putative FmdB family regulatory protein